MKRAAIALALALLAGAAQAGLFDDEEARKGVEQSKKDITQLQAGAKSLDARVARIEEAVKSQSMLDLLNQIEALKQDIARLRGQIEELKFAEESAQKRQKDFYVDLDTRLRRLEQPGAAVPGAAAPPAAPAGTPPAPAASGTSPVPEAAPRTAAAAPAAPGAGQAGADTANEVRAYDAAYNLFKIGNYQGAIAGFQNFLKAYPASIFAPNAYYWIGNAFFNLRDYKSAIATQQKLLAAHADSPKAPDAMLNIASSQQELGDAASAKKTLHDLVAKYPASDAADKAKRRLASIK